MVLELRLARESDADRMLAIYAPIVRETAISFELAPPDPEEMRQRIRRISSRHAWLVCEDEGMIAGYAYASQFRPREAYQWTAEVTVYVHPLRQRRGIGGTLYAALFAALRLQGYTSAIAVIALPNDASVRLHERCAFRAVGVFERAGYKLGRWHDVGWWQLELQAASANPQPPRALTELAENGELERVLSSYRLT
jgi:L-amino acid N-acyltransferase YncA